MYKLNRPSGNEALEASLLVSSGGNRRLNSEREWESLRLLLLSSLPSLYSTCWLRRRFTRSVSDVAYSPYTSCICAIVNWSSYSTSESSIRARFKPTIHQNMLNLSWRLYTTWHLLQSGSHIFGTRYSTDPLYHHGHFIPSALLPLMCRTVCRHCHCPSSINTLRFYCLNIYWITMRLAAGFDMTLSCIFNSLLCTHTKFFFTPQHSESYSFVRNKNNYDDHINNNWHNITSWLSVISATPATHWVQ